MHKKHDILGHIVKTARKCNDLTREQLAEKLGITPRYLMSIENENKKPSYDLLFRLIRILDISSDSIFLKDSVFSVAVGQNRTQSLFCSQAVIAREVRRRPCDFASPPLGGFAHIFDCYEVAYKVVLFTWS